MLNAEFCRKREKKPQWSTDARPQALALSLVEWVSEFYIVVSADDVIVR